MLRAGSELVERLTTAPLEVVGRIAGASNTTLLCALADTSDGTLVVYKPARGEAPLWDFPPRTLHLRELAAYVVDRALGWDLVPPTVLRAAGPLGAGSAQLFVDHDPARHYFALFEEGRPEVLAQLEAMVVFDLVVNNADRKGSHVLLDATGRIRLVDHGVCFHVEPKLRTVAWDLVGEPVPEDLRADVARLGDALDAPGGGVRAELGQLLSEEEVAATTRRARRTATLDRYPPPRGERPFPWPPL